MFATDVYHYREPAALVIGLRELRKRGLTPRGLLFVALDPRGEAHVVIAKEPEAVAEIKVGEKLAIVSPLEGRYFHFDSVHRLPGDTVLWNGDRRLSDTGSAPEVARSIAEWLKGSSAKNVFLGCNAHVPGSWWAVDHMSPVIDLHALGLADCVVAHTGLLARKIGDTNIYHLPFSQLTKRDGPRAGWHPVFVSTLGNVLLLERRVLNYRLVLTCERGLLEIDVAHLPDLVIETARAELASGFGVVGRFDRGGFAVTAGKVEPWGFSSLRPAVIIGGPNGSIADLPQALQTLEGT